MTLYSSLLTPSPKQCSQASESSVLYLFLTERHMQALWLEQKYFKNLTTVEGFPIKVISPGIWNAEAGPDFLKAHIQIGDQELRGDIELHLSDNGWKNHHHHQDPRYDRVILHISFWPSAHPKEIFSSQNISIARAYLKEFLTISESRILKIIDLDLYPYQHFVGSGQCARALFHSLTPQKTIAFFRSAALWRLEQKQQYLKEKLGPPEECLVGGMAMTLGYKHNAEAFLDLYVQMKALPVQDEHSLTAYALGVCGFFQEPYALKWSHSTFYSTLQKTFEKHFSNAAPPFVKLRLDKIRPANHPVRRLATLAKIASDQSLLDLLGTLLHEWRSSWKDSQNNNWKGFLQKLLDLFPVYSDSYWEYHYAFEKDPQVRSIALLGEDHKREILVNIFFPILFAELKSPEDIQAFQTFYASLPASKSRKALYLGHRFFGETRKTHILNKADVQQGAFQLHRDFCLQYEASCVGCPFVERFKSLFL